MIAKSLLSSPVNDEIYKLSSFPSEDSEDPGERQISGRLIIYTSFLGFTDAGFRGARLNRVNPLGRGPRASSGSGKPSLYAADSAFPAPQYQPRCRLQTAGTRAEITVRCGSNLPDQAGEAGDPNAVSPRVELCTPA